jgi:hypothetical protein
MKKSTDLLKGKGYAKEVKYSSAPIPKMDEREFRMQIHHQMTMHPDYVDDTNPENRLFKCSGMGEY